jgi:NTP pyrophosphatase (non-canonical NTP hydrolase)
MEIRAFQQLIAELYLAADSQRGLSGTYFWFMEEVGELTRALRRGHTGDELAGEFADVFAWLTSLANMQGIDLESAVRGKYLAAGRPGHHKDLAVQDQPAPGS